MRAPSLVLLLTIALPSLASAQGVPPDLVRTRDGGMLRGTIIEKVPGDHVEIQLPNGQTRSLKMSEVEYAGPAGGDAAPAPAPAVMRTNTTTIDVPMARLELQSKQQGLTFHRKAGSGYGAAAGWVGGNNSGPVSLAFTSTSFERLCTTPCAAEVPKGTYKLGLSLRDGGVVATEALDLRGHMRLEGEYTSNANTRRAGWAVAILSVGIGTALALTSTRDNCDSNNICTSNHPYLIPGIIVLGAGGTLGFLMTFVGDDVSIRATPLP
jgi:hypothetical protein